MRPHAHRGTSVTAQGVMEGRRQPELVKPQQRLRSARSQEVPLASWQRQRMEALGGEQAQVKAESLRSNDRSSNRIGGLPSCARAVSAAGSPGWRPEPGSGGHRVPTNILPRRRRCAERAEVRPIVFYCGKTRRISAGEGQLHLMHPTMGGIPIQYKLQWQKRKGPTATSQASVAQLQEGCGGRGDAVSLPHLGRSTLQTARQVENWPGNLWELESLENH
ncbi:hypothetical protein NDU88_003783 [Pleurodeles waltl]|uniref:Uncharacterized protein n=1 Tax=Pleurodeles waltl TaxID=8319 RepID=A0AAV7VID7_PLEWA|nr:hypothetical protein NDU88_003783 [Pleurodeles waltl]